MTEGEGDEQAASSDAMREQIRSSPATHVMVAVPDRDGALRAKHLAKHKVLDALEGGLHFCDVVLGFDRSDGVYENTSIAGWHTGFPDQPVLIDPTSFRSLPGEGSSHLVLAEYASPLACKCLDHRRARESRCACQERTPIRTWRLRPPLPPGSGGSSTRSSRAFRGPGTLMRMTTAQACRVRCPKQLPSSQRRAPPRPCSAANLSTTSPGPANGRSESLVGTSATGSLHAI